MTIKSFTVDAEKCTGCLLCVLSCKDEHVGHTYAPYTKPQPDTGHFWIGLRSLERGTIPKVSVTHMPVMCQHCANAPCASACGKGAIKTREDGLVWIDPALCDGCGDCKKACPYGVIYDNEALGIAQKCTGCAHRVDEGLEPRCVEVCPHDAILFGSATPPGSGFEPLEPEHGAEPRVMWTGLPRPWIAGAVVEPGGEEVVIGATVTATDTTDATAITTTTDGFGDFWLKKLTRGRSYRIAVTATGFVRYETTIAALGGNNLGSIELKRA